GSPVPAGDSVTASVAPDSVAAPSGTISLAPTSTVPAPAPAPPVRVSDATLSAADEGPATPIQWPAAASSVGRFVLRGRLGEGAFGIVHRAHDPQLDREVALKVAKAGALGTARHVERFLREARAAAGLRHPNIVPLFEA